jgi:hypothetical protein
VKLKKNITYGQVLQDLSCVAVNDTADIKYAGQFLKQPTMHPVNLKARSETGGLWKSPKY